VKLLIARRKGTINGPHRNVTSADVTAVQQTVDRVCEASALWRTGGCRSPSGSNWQLCYCSTGQVRLSTRAVALADGEEQGEQGELQQRFPRTACESEGLEDTTNMITA
jgi:hypothetical protein